LSRIEDLADGRQYATDAANAQAMSLLQGMAARYAGA
jgi:hypothetical protein